VTGRSEALLDALAPFVIGASVLAAAAGSSIQYDILRVGRPTRWLALGVLVAFAVVRALPVWGDLRFPRVAAGLLAVFCAVAIVSTAWSVNARDTLGRSVVQAFVIGAIALLASVATLRPHLARRMVDGVIVASAVVAAAGFVYWLITPSRAVLSATTDYGARYQGIEQNPNTGSLLFAIAISFAIARALEERRWKACAFVGVTIGLAVSISASGSRGALLAAFAGTLVIALLARARADRRAALVAAVVVGAGLCTWGASLAKPTAPPAAARVASPSAVVSPNAEATLPLDQEIGNPWWTRRASDSHRSLFSTSVRLRALRGAIRLAFQRPLLGFGFGAEQWAFFNRYYAFSSGNSENGYVGLFLQTGFVGLSLFLAAVGFSVVPTIRTWRRGSGGPTTLAAIGGAVGALALGLSQSFFHGVGNIGYVAVWVAVLLAAAQRLSSAAPAAAKAR
jgi:hypothetical protein